MPKFFKSITTRLAFGYGLLVAGSILIFSIVIYIGTIGVLDRSIDGKIQAIADRLVQNYDNRPLADLIHDINRQMTDGIDSDTEIFLVMSSDGRRLGGNLTANVSATTPVKVIRTQDVVRYDKPVRARITVRRLPDGNALVVGRALHEQEAIQALIVRALLAGAAISVLLAAAGTVLFRHLLQRRLAGIRHTAEAIEAGDLSRRIPIASDDEFGRLNLDINQMLDRIEHLMDGVRQVSNDIAHDLRTPLSRIRRQLEQALPHGTDKSSTIHNAVADAISGIDDLIGLFDKLLQIAEAESGIRTQSFEAVNLSRIANDMTELYDAAAEENDIELSAKGDLRAIAMGDHNLLASAVASLIDNAIKYAGRGAKVYVTATADTENVCLTVKDDGPGIPIAEIGKVTQRFYRLDRSRGLPGNGLGLAIVSAIAKLHGGTLQLESGSGLACRIVLPRNLVLISSEARR